MVHSVEPNIYLISRPQLDWSEIERYLRSIDGVEWLKRHEEMPEGEGSPGQDLLEIAGRNCYRSWKPGLNPNVTKIREDQGEYLKNVLASKHGSVLEHAQYTFVFANVSRVFTHELVRHRAGTAISQESMRFVRLDDIPFWWPGWATHDEELHERALALLTQMEDFQLWMAKHFGLDDEGTPFHEKKAKTSFMRRFAPDGVATSMVWSANVRTLRHVIEARTNSGAEEEIRLVFDKVGWIMMEEAPMLFGDFERDTDLQWLPKWSKV